MRISSTNYGFERGLRVKVTTDAASEPVTKTEFKDYAAVDYSDDDNLIDDLIVAARKMVEDYIQRKIGSQTLTAHWTSYPKFLRLPYAPINSVTTVKTIDSEGTKTTLVNATDYFVKGDDDKYIEFGSYGNYGLEVIYTAGYTTVPKALKSAILRVVANLYEHRGDDSESFQLDTLTKQLAKPYKVMSI